MRGSLSVLAPLVGRPCPAMVTWRNFLRWRGGPGLKMGLCRPRDDGAVLAPMVVGWGSAHVRTTPGLPRGPHRAVCLCGGRPETSLRAICPILRAPRQAMTGGSSKGRGSGVPRPACPTRDRRPGPFSASGACEGGWPCVARHDLDLQRQTEGWGRTPACALQDGEETYTK